MGITVAEADKRGLKVRNHRLGLEHVPRAIVDMSTDGWIELVVTEADGRIVGVQAVGTAAVEMIGAATLAVRLGLRTEEIASTFQPYLTWMEGLKLGAQGFDQDVARLSCCT